MTNLGNGRFDAAIIGGGVYGILLALEGASRGQRVLLLERDDFGGGTTFNHLRTIHGGLRYLQSLDLRRAVMSNRQRLWWLRTFPDLIHPIECLMPLYGKAIRRPETFRAAFLLAKLLGLHKSSEEGPRRMELVSAEEMRSLLPYCRQVDLKGGALWEDAFMPKPHRVIAELLHWAESAGAILLNRMELASASRDRNNTWRCSVRNDRTGDTVELAARWLINATAADSDEVIRRITGRERSRVFVPTMAWGILFDRPPVAECSVAVTPPGRRRRTYFVHPYHDSMLAGTGYAGIPPGAPAPSGVPDRQLEGTLADLNEAMPGLGLTREGVRYVFRGLLPGVRAASEELLKHPRIIDHGARDGAPGVWTVLGVKFTEAPFVANLLWNYVLGSRPQAFPGRPAPLTVPSIDDARAMSDEELAAALGRLAEREWRPDVNDVIWRRTDFWMDQTQARRVATLAARMELSRP